MEVYIVLQMVELDIVARWVFRSESKAMMLFEVLACEDSLRMHDCKPSDFSCEGTLALAGDDACAVQVIKATLDGGE